MSKIPLKMIKFLRDDKLSPAPKYENGYYQVFANEDVILKPNSIQKIKTGLKLEFTEKYFANVHGSTNDLKVLAGVVDSDYRGEVSIIAFNRKTEDVLIQKNSLCARIQFIEVSDLDIEEVASF